MDGSAWELQARSKCMHSKAAQCLHLAVLGRLSFLSAGWTDQTQMQAQAALTKDSGKSHTRLGLLPYTRLSTAVVDNM